jgi:hypothetical protein
MDGNHVVQSERHLPVLPCFCALVLYLRVDLFLDMSSHRFSASLLQGSR